MPVFDLVYFETTKITSRVEAATYEEAIAIDSKREGWDECEEETLGTNGVEEVYDKAGNLVYAADGRHEEDL